MSAIPLGKLEPVDPRQVWPREAGDSLPPDGAKLTGEASA